MEIYQVCTIVHETQIMLPRMPKHGGLHDFLVYYLILPDQ